jgi:hypothetical protein
MRRQFSLTTILLWVSATTLWLALVAELANFIGRSDTELNVVALVTLIGMTAAIRHLLRRRQNALPIAAIVAALLTFATSIWFLTAVDALT